MNKKPRLQESPDDTTNSIWESPSSTSRTKSSRQLIDLCSAADDNEDDDEEEENRAASELADAKIKLEDANTETRQSRTSLRIAERRIKELETMPSV